MLYCPKCGRHYSSDVLECLEDGTPLKAEATVAFSLAEDPLIGKVFNGKYRLEGLIGEGGMGAVYRATHLLIDRPVAIKVLSPAFGEDDAARTRFQREARAAGRLQHANAVAVTDFGTSTDGYLYIVMELLEGRSLREVLAREAPLDQARSVSLMLQVSAAVAAAHEAGIIHRDLKPANIFIQQRKHAPPLVKVLDFGIAKLVADSLDESEQQSLTQTGVMIGTPRYMSPEQCESRELTPASDVYSLGIILYEMLTGTTPFSGSSPLAIAMKHSNEYPQPPRQYVSTIAPELESVVLHALEKNPANRPQDAGAFRSDLYTVAQTLGLEHFAGGGIHSLDTLRNAGVESPSGRLVVDMDRLRNSRGGTTEIVKRGQTNRQGSLTVHENVVLPEDEPPPSGGGNPVSEEKPSAYPEPVGPFSRVHVDLPHRRRWFKRPLAFTGLVLGGVVLLVLAAVSFNLSRSSQPDPASGRATPSATPAISPVKATPAPEASPTVSPAEASEEDGKGTDGRTKDGKRNSRQGEQPQRPAKKDSRVKSILKKAGRIFKNPF
jgi:serine/threonine protein kinase